jgi:hypothetical protein
LILVTPFLIVITTIIAALASCASNLLAFLYNRVSLYFWAFEMEL